MVGILSTLEAAYCRPSSGMVEGFSGVETIMIQVSLSRPQLMIIRRLSLAECRRIRDASEKPFYCDGSAYGSSVLALLESAERQIKKAVTERNHPKKRLNV